VRKSRQLFAEHLLNNRLQMGLFHCNWGARNANKTNENRSVRTGQGELENRRQESTFVGQDTAETFGSPPQNR